MDCIISIITINYNNSSELIKTAESVFKQRFKNFEYIIIDGGSTDGSAVYIDSVREKLAYSVSETDNGVYHAMNKGWRQAKGQYCLFLNSGDYLYDEHILEKVAIALRQESPDILYGDLYAFDDRQNWVSQFKEPISLYYFYYSFLPHPASFIRRDLLMCQNGFLEHYKAISDWAFFVKALLLGAKFYHLEEVVTSFNMVGISSDGSAVHKDREKIMENEFAFLKEDFKVFERFRNYELSRGVQLAQKVLDIKSKFFKQ